MIGSTLISGGTSSPIPYAVISDTVVIKNTNSATKNYY
jgi:hypothetical protein